MVNDTAANDTTHSSGALPAGPHNILRYELSNREEVPLPSDF